MKNKYIQKKEKAREEAINWQRNFEEYNYSYEELINFQNHFRMLSKKYGLISEFKENGIC